MPNGIHPQTLDYIDGVNFVIAALIKTLSARGHLDTTALRDILKTFQSKMDQEKRESATGLVVQRFIDLSNPKPDDPIPEGGLPDWFRGIIPGGRGEDEE